METKRQKIEDTSRELLESYPECLIINRPDLKSMPRILGEELLTLVFWGFWFYLWLPLISALAWLFGFRILYSHIVALGGLDGFLSQLDVFCSGIAIASGTMALWSFYTFKRYGAMHRRTRIRVTDQEALKQAFALTDGQLRRMRRARRITIFFSPRGGMTGGVRWRRNLRGKESKTIPRTREGVN